MITKEIIQEELLYRGYRVDLVFSPIIESYIEEILGSTIGKIVGKQTVSPGFVKTLKSAAFRVKGKIQGLNNQMTKLVAKEKSVSGQISLFKQQGATGPAVDNLNKSYAVIKAQKETLRNQIARERKQLGNITSKLAGVTA